MRSDNHPPSPVVIGEVLFDQFEDGSRVLGGAPFNVAWHLHGLGLRPRFISAVGADADGDCILQRMEDAGMDTRYVQRVDEKATGAVNVRVTDGSPSYEILEDRAWDSLDYHPLEESDATALLYHGSLACRGEHNRAVIERWRQEWPGMVLFDANLRPPHYTVQRVNDLTRNVRWMKLNEEELVELCAEGEFDFGDAEPHAQSYLERYNAHGLALTGGKEGAAVITRDASAKISPAPKPEPMVDTVGAGDSFTAAFIFGLLQGWPLQTIVERASGFACRICQQQGAIPDNPNLYYHVLSTWNA
ncbi:MAG: PfkB family carbohydrate kinase [Opitutales bacterium]